MLENFDRYLPDDAPPAVRQGYAKQSRLQLDILRQVDEPASEIMVDSTGRYTVAIQSTMSRGTVRPSGPNILKDNKPVIDPRYCAHPLDVCARQDGTDPSLVVGFLADYCCRDFLVRGCNAVISNECPSDEN